MNASVRVATVAAAVTVSLTVFVRAQNPGLGGLGGQTPAPQLGMLATVDPVTLFSADDPAVTDPAASESATTNPPHLPKGGKFKLFGTAAQALDPQNPFNEVISFDTTSGAVAGAYRKIGDHVKVGMLTNQLELKYFFVGRTCGGGSPRIQLGIDGDGDGKFNQTTGGPDQNAFGYLGDKPFGGGCLMNQWVYEDMTDGAAKWDLSQWTPLPTCDMTCTWTQVMTYFTTNYPNHRVMNAVLVDDSSSFFVADQGCAYFDLISSGGDTLDDWSDATDGGKQPTNCPG